MVYEAGERSEQRKRPNTDPSEEGRGSRCSDQSVWAGQASGGAGRVGVFFGRKVLVDQNTMACGEAEEGEEAEKEVNKEGCAWWRDA